MATEVVVVVVLTVCLTYVSVRQRDAPNWVAEHLGASSRRPAVMAGVNPGRVPVYTAPKTHPVTP